MKKRVAKVVLGMALIGMLSACGKEEVTTDVTVEANSEVAYSEEDKEEEKVAEAVDSQVSESDFVCNEIEGIMTLTEYTGSATVVTVPEAIEGKNITAIGDRAFSQNETITEVVLPDSVTVIGEGAFSMCGALLKVTLGANTEIIKNEAFLNSYELTEINLPDTIIELGQDAFSGPSLKEITIPIKLEIIPTSGFAFMKAESLIIPGNIKVIEEYAFSISDNLKKVEIQEGVEIIEDSAFATCKNLEMVYLPNSITEINEYAFMDSGDFTIVTPAGSYAEQFANENDIPVVNE